MTIGTRVGSSVTTGPGAGPRGRGRTHPPPRGRTTSRGCIRPPVTRTTRCTQRTSTETAAAASAAAAAAGVVVVAAAAAVVAAAVVVVAAAAAAAGADAACDGGGDDLDGAAVADVAVGVVTAPVTVAVPLVRLSVRRAACRRTS